MFGRIFQNQFDLDFASDFMIAGPDLPVKLSGHSMVALGLGQAVIGGESNQQYTKKIYHLVCSREDCGFSKMGQELSIARGSFVAIPIPDIFSGCILEGMLVISVV